MAETNNLVNWLSGIRRRDLGHIPFLQFNQLVLQSVYSIKLIKMIWMHCLNLSACMNIKCTKPCIEMRVIQSQIPLFFQVWKKFLPFTKFSWFFQRLEKLERDDGKIKSGHSFLVRKWSLMSQESIFLRVWWYNIFADMPILVIADIFHMGWSHVNNILSIYFQCWYSISTTSTFKIFADSRYWKKKSILPMPI